MRFAGIRSPAPPTFYGCLVIYTPTFCGLMPTVMRDDDLRRALTDANPWWRAAAHRTDPIAWVTGHPLLVDRAQHDVGYRAGVLDDIATVPRIDDRLVVLTEIGRAHV